MNYNKINNIYNYNNRHNLNKNLKNNINNNNSIFNKILISDRRYKIKINHCH